MEDVLSLPGRDWRGIIIINNNWISNARISWEKVLNAAGARDNFIGTFPGQAWIKIGN